MYGDPDHLDALAADLDRRADQVDQRASEFVARTDAAQWASTAADAMRARALATAGSFHTVARLYRDAAEAVRAHARSVRRVLALIEAIERAVMRLVNEAWDRISSLGSTIADATGDVVDAVGDGLSEMGNWITGGNDEPATPDPADVSLCETQWPPPGHRDWLAHAQLARVA